MKNRKRQRGQSLTEYLILVALIAISSIGVIRVLGDTTKVQLANIAKGLQGGHVKKIDNVKIKKSLYSTKDLSNFLDNSSYRGKN